MARNTQVGRKSMLKTKNEREKGDTRTHELSLIEIYVPGGQAGTLYAEHADR